MLLRPAAFLFAMLLIALPLTAFHAHASGGGESSEAESKLPFKYLELKPPFIVNVGETGRVGFLKVEISLRVKSEAVAAVEHHMPALRHELVMLLSRQKQERLDDAKAREEVRQEALEAVRKVLEEEDGTKGEEGITDLLFTSFLMQR